MQTWRRFSVTSAFLFHATLSALVLANTFFGLPEQSSGKPKQEACSGLACGDGNLPANSKDARLVPAADDSPTIAELSKPFVHFAVASHEEPFCGTPTPSNLPGPGGCSLSSTLQAQHVRLQI